jgi:mono/diheme cytochrome c family protein
MIKLSSLRMHSVAWRLAVVLGTFTVATGVQAAATESDRDYCERQQGIARVVCLRDLPTSTTAQGGAPAAQAPTGAESDRAYCERQQGVARTVCLRDLKASASAGGGSAKTDAPARTAFKVVDGYHVDATTFKGFQTWRTAACDRCHGANQQGLVGPSLINSLKVLTHDDFVKTVTGGRLDKGMPSFKENTTVMANLDALYSYLKGRSDGVITQAHVERIP